MDKENKELTEKELKQVCGGFSEQNGLYSLNKGDFFVAELDNGSIKHTWTIEDDYTNITLNTPIRYYWTLERNGMLDDMKLYEQGTLRQILNYGRAEYVGK